MKFAYTIVYVPDVAAALDFYERALGLTRRFLHEGGDYGELDTGATTLAFASEDLMRENGLTARPNRLEEQAAAIELAFVTDDVPAAVAVAVEAGATQVKAAAVKPWGQTVAYLRDPQGVLLELCTPVSG